VPFYWKAWELAWSHVLLRDDTPQKFYIDPAMHPGKTWIWDTCFMALFCRYAPGVFPGAESLNNFYYIIHDKKPSAVTIHFADNPPLFAWIEWEYYKMTGDKARLEWLMDHQYLQKHWEFIEHGKWKSYKRVLVTPSAHRVPLGYTWRGNTSGMDNTPRGRNWWNNTKKFNPRGQIGLNAILWVDLLAQQALGAKYIAKIAEETGHKQVAETYQRKFEELKSITNEYYWNPTEQFYFDIFYRPTWWLKYLHQKEKNIQNQVKTIASYWPMLAEISTPDQAQALMEKAADPNQFGGKIPWPSLTRQDPEFRPQGRYWRGGVWLPTTYMATKALERYGFFTLADDYAERFVKNMLETYQQYNPHTIWEVYSPSDPKPASQKRDEEGKTMPDFCGWSALGPIALFIENVIGIHEINAPEKIIKWRIHHVKKHGIQNLSLGPFAVDLIYEKNTIHAKTKDTIELQIINGKGEITKMFTLKPGENVFTGIQPDIN